MLIRKVRDILSKETITMSVLRKLKTDHKQTFDHIKLSGKGRNKAAIVRDIRKWLDDQDNLRRQPACPQTPADHSAELRRLRAADRGVAHSLTIAEANGQTPEAESRPRRLPAAESDEKAESLDEMERQINDAMASDDPFRSARAPAAPALRSTTKARATLGHASGLRPREFPDSDDEDSIVTQQRALGKWHIK